MRIPVRCAAIVLLALPLVAQNAPQSASEPDQLSVLHASARLVVVDVTVTDSHGVPVHGLPQSAFHLAESRHPQSIVSFEEHTSADTAAAVSQPPLQPGVFTNVLSVSSQSPVNILVLDRLNTPMENQAWVRAKILEFLRTAPPDTRMAIFGLNSELVMLQGLTSNPALLRAAIAHDHPQHADLQNLDSGPQTDPALAAQLGADGGSELAAALEAFEDTAQDVNANQRGAIMLRAFNQIARYVAGIPGRKNLIWFSAAFPLDIMPSQSDHPGSVLADRNGGQAFWNAEYREAIDIVSRSQIAIYPVDARGLTSGFDARMSGMQDAAYDTGGKAFINTNGLAEAVQQAIANGSNYYTLSYAPASASPHGEFRSINVKLDNARGFHVSYRRGYYAEAAGSSLPSAAVKAASFRTASAKAAPIPHSAVQSAAAYITPPATQIGFYAHVQAVPADASENPAPGQPRRRLSFAHTRDFNVEYSTDPRNLATTETPDGLHHAHVEFIAFAYNAQGRIIRSYVKSVQVTWTAQQFASALKGGLRYQQPIELPADGSPMLRLMVHDLANDHLGSLDVPVSALKSN